MNELAKLCVLGVCVATLNSQLSPMNWLQRFTAWIAQKASLSQYVREFMIGNDVVPGGAARLHYPYAKSAWVMSAINHVTQPIKSVTLKFYEGDKEIENPLLDAFWQNPAKGLSYEEIIDASLGWYKLAGEFFWLLDDSWALPSRTKRSQFIVARPPDMQEVVKAGVLLGWQWKDAGGMTHALLPEDVIQIKRWNPYNVWRGLGEMQAAQIAAEADYQASRYARDVYSNQGESGDYIVAKNGIPTTEQQDQIVAQLREKRAAKLRGDFRPVFLAGDIEVQNAQVTAPDAGFVANRLSNRHEVYIAFGVPASMADVVASYSIGSASDYFRLIFQTCIPLSCTLGGAIDKVTRMIVPSVTIESYFEFDEHPVMQQVRAERIQSAAQLFSFGMPVKEISDYLDMGLPRFKGDDIGYLPMGLAPASEAAEPERVPTQDPALAEEAGSGAIADMIALLRAPSSMLHASKAADPGEALWNSHMAKRRQTAKIFHGKIKKVLMTARAECLRKAEQQGAGSKELGAIQRAGAAADFLFNLAEFTNELVAEMRKAHHVALETAGTELFEEVDKDDPFHMPPQRVLSFLSQRENRIRDCAQEIFDQVTHGIQEGLDAGDSTAQIADRIRAAFQSVSKGRAMTIAQTETSTAYGVARDEAMKQAGVKYKKWLTSRNANVRATHRAAEGQTVELHEAFTVGGAKLMFPGDPSGPPEEVINCHCVQIAEAAPAAERSTANSTLS